MDHPRTLPHFVIITNKLDGQDEYGQPTISRGAKYAGKQALAAMRELRQMATELAAKQPGEPWVLTTDTAAVIHNAEERAIIWLDLYELTEDWAEAPNADTFMLIEEGPRDFSRPPDMSTRQSRLRYVGESALTKTRVRILGPSPRTAHAEIDEELKRLAGPGDVSRNAGLSGSVRGKGFEIKAIVRLMWITNSFSIGRGTTL